MIWADRVVLILFIMFAVLFGFFAMHGDLENPAISSYFGAITYAAFYYGFPTWLLLRAIDAVSTGQLFRVRRQ